MKSRMGTLLDISAERQRQIEKEGFSFEHDDRHDRGELVAAALAYATHAMIIAKLRADGYPPEEIAAKDAEAPLPAFWPWAPEWWKPKGQRRDLERAGALILAELERLNRVEARAVQK